MGRSIYSWNNHQHDQLNLYCQVSDQGSDQGGEIRVLCYEKLVRKGDTARPGRGEHEPGFTALTSGTADHEADPIITAVNQAGRTKSGTRAAMSGRGETTRHGAGEGEQPDQEVQL